jgi:hypothetical protein
MNERIKELAKSVQCERQWTEEDIEKFAELIVRECAQISIGTNPCFMEASTLEDGASRMFKHFGVK